MTNEQDGPDPSPPIKGLDEARDAARNAARGLPPVHLWEPERVYDLDMRIRRDGVWEYQGSPITRFALMRLFSTILRRDPDGAYYLVTPVEKARIQVEDAPFVAVEVMFSGQGRDQILTFRTNVEDRVVAGPDHAIRMEIDSATGEPSPYVHVRAGLEALIARPVYYDLVERAEIHDADGERLFGIWSGGIFFPFAPADAVEPE